MIERRWAKTVEHRSRHDGQKVQIVSEGGTEAMPVEVEEMVAKARMDGVLGPWFLLRQPAQRMYLQQLRRRVLVIHDVFQLGLG